MLRLEEGGTTVHVVQYRRRSSSSTCICAEPCLVECYSPIPLHGICTSRLVKDGRHVWLWDDSLGLHNGGVTCVR